MERVGVGVSRWLVAVVDEGGLYGFSQLIFLSVVTIILRSNLYPPDLNRKTENGMPTDFPPVDGTIHIVAEIRLRKLLVVPAARSETNLTAHRPICKATWLDTPPIYRFLSNGTHYPDFRLEIS